MKIKEFKNEELAYFLADADTEKRDFYCRGAIFIAEKNDNKNVFYKKISKKLELEDYDIFLPEDIEKNLKDGKLIIDIKYYVVVYMDKDAGYSNGVIIFTGEEVDNMINGRINELKNFL